MIEVRTTECFDTWYAALRDRKARIRIQVRIDRLAAGNPGQHRMLPEGLYELKVDYGPGYRVYYARKGAAFVILPCGGDKKTQRRDLETAVALKRMMET